MGLIRSLLSRESRFQTRVLEVLKRSYPELRQGPGPIARTVLIENGEFDLQALFARCRDNETETESIVQQHFSHVAAMIVRPPYSMTWAEVKEVVRPQLLPKEHAEKLHVHTYPIAGEIVAGIVVDYKTAPWFVREEHLKQWKIQASELYGASIQNLADTRVKMEVTITEGTDRFIGLEAGDGYDAARILVPKIRKFAAAKLEEPYFAGIPNRDFLILWSRNCSKRFREYAIKKVETDFSIQSYPLSTMLFEVTASSVKPITPNT